MCVCVTIYTSVLPRVSLTWPAPATLTKWGESGRSVKQLSSAFTTRYPGADSGFEIRGGGIISMVVGGSGGMPPQENFDFGPLKMAIWELLLSYQLFNYIYKLHTLCIQNTT